MTDKSKLIAAILVAALGYFVDIYDLLLFSIVRVSSLKDLGLSGEELTNTGIFLLDVQMCGMLIGGIAWGIWGDRKGRLSVLFGSILMYSIANIANGLTHSVTGYAVWRFVAGLGLAGELGAGITLVAELMPKGKRGYATMLVASVGISGAVVAYFVSDLFPWRTSFLIGGGLGILLLLLRIGVAESGMFAQAKKSQHRGNFLALFRTRANAVKYLRCILIGFPLWYVVGILVTLSPEFGRLLGVRGEISGGLAIAWCYGGMALGDIVSGLLSQLLKSRIKVVYIFLVLAVVAVGGYLFGPGMSVQWFYPLCGLLGFSVGYWVIFMTISTEQFGTNIRATVTTTAPNFARGALVPSTILFHLFTRWTGSMITGAAIVGAILFLLAFWALRKMRETFSEDLDYIEEFK
ncbi:MAG: MFS transporter [Chitinophagaceae bacterium]|nr:MFS transporter [Sphingobacteriales bacterium]OJW00069.1 MAG: MFS transporter [Sphingobacteriales bacterium 44-61]TXJ29097.1 MAG: MFS transporter [Chitinophagaceae bacterium]